MLKLNTESKIDDLNNIVNRKMSENNIRAALQGSEIKIKKEL